MPNTGGWDRRRSSFVLAPALVVATLVLFGSGVAFLAVSGTHPLRTIHTFAFLAWGVLMIVHVLAYL